MGGQDQGRVLFLLLMSCKERKLACGSQPGRTVLIILCLSHSRFVCLPVSLFLFLSCSLLFFLFLPLCGKYYK
jgi:hypothetical protein